MSTLTASAPSSFEPPGTSGSSPSSSSMEEAKKRQNHNAPLPTSRLERCNTAPLDLNPTSKRPDIPPPPNRHLRRRNSLLPERRLGSFSSSSRPPISPALYVTPESTPLPDSPNSLPPLSPYVINHKRRGPRLHKSYSYFQKNVDEVDARLYNAHLRRFSEGDLRRKEHADEDLAGESKAGDGGSVFQKDESANGSSGDVVGGNAVADLKILTGQISSLKRDDGETDDFFDPQETMSLMNYSIDGEDYSGDLSARMTTPMAEFYDAWEELSSESGWQSRRSFFNTEIELRDMRMSLVTEIEQRKQSEEGVKSMRRQCELLREKLASAGLSEADPVEDLCEQVQVTRFVSESIGWAAAKAEAEDEMKAQLEAKNFEIARLSDRLHYYETMNWEMSQRNQEAIENTRRERQKMRRRQELIWGSVGAAITLGTATLVWSFIPTGKGYVAVVGKPNVGKSTLSNQMIGQKLSIVTDKPQTTRHRILGICSGEDYQMILYDTPGVIEKKMHKLDSMMMKNVRSATINADCVVVVVDACKMPEKIDEVLEEGIGNLKEKLPTLLVMNKKDLIKPGEIAKKLQYYEKFTDVDEVIPVSAKYGHGVDDVKDWILSKLPVGPPYYPKDIASEHPERFFVGEIVREKIFLQYKNEVPYACQVNVVSYKSRPGAKDFIQVEIVVEKNSQKIILIGKEGKALKLLATAARLDIEDFLQKKVYLEVEVKVKVNWRQDEGLLKDYGYGGQIRVL